MKIQVGWIDEFGNLFPMAAWKPAQKSYSDDHKAKWRPVYDAPEFVPLRAHGVLDADNNLDCWDTPPFDIATQHVAALNERDPGAMWRVEQLYVRAKP